MRDPPILGDWWTQPQEEEVDLRDWKVFARHGYFRSGTQHSRSFPQIFHQGVYILEKKNISPLHLWILSHNAKMHKIHVVFSWWNKLRWKHWTFFRGGLLILNCLMSMYDAWVLTNNNSGGVQPVVRSMPTLDLNFEGSKNLHLDAETKKHLQTLEEIRYIPILILGSFCIH